MNEIAFTKDYLKKYEYWFFPISIAIWIVVFSTLDISREDRFSLSTCLMAIPMILWFYSLRFEPKTVEFNNENINISYINDFKWLFGKNDFRGFKAEVNAIKNNDMIILSNVGGTIAKIRRKALRAEDWDMLNNYSFDLQLYK